MMGRIQHIKTLEDLIKLREETMANPGVNIPPRVEMNKEDQKELWEYWSQNIARQERKRKGGTIISEDALREKIAGILKVEKFSPEVDEYIKILKDRT